MVPADCLCVQFSALGVGCAGAAVLLYEGIRVSEVVLRPLPRWASAPLGGALCGIIAFKFPQVRSRIASRCSVDDDASG
jgi:H+/Cl- antiporter ClcA